MTTIKKIRIALVTFIVLLALSGITAFPIETEMKFAIEFLDAMDWNEGMFAWMRKITPEIQAIYADAPYLAYGTDWLAFAHLVIAVVFIGPLKDPVKNIWCIQFGMIACCMVFPLAFIAGYIREIPFTWRLIDCSFGVVGFFVQLYVYILIRRLEKKDKMTIPDGV